MTPERVQALQYVGFVWDANAAVWNECFEQLLEFKAQFGHCLVPQQYSANSKLGRWVANQRYTYKLYQEGTPCRMTAERVRKLESVGFFLETYTSSRGKQSIVWIQGTIRPLQLCQRANLPTSILTHIHCLQVVCGRKEELHDSCMNSCAQQHWLCWKAGSHSCLEDHDLYQVAKYDWLALKNLDLRICNDFSNQFLVLWRVLSQGSSEPAWYRVNRLLLIHLDLNFNSN